MTNISDRVEGKDISVVVQGAIDNKLTSKCLKRIRLHLPNSKIVLSTWTDQDISCLDKKLYDDLVLSEDPKGVICDDVHKVPNNVNRQILSTKNGLKKVNTLYALKMRSDMALEGSNFLSFFKKFKERSSEYKILTERILINNLYSANPRRTRFLFHPSDWVCFGLTEDLLKVWDIDLAPEPKNSRYFEARIKPSDAPVPSWLFQYIPEQYIWVSFLRKFMPINFSHYFDFNEEKLQISEKIFANNTVILNYGSMFDIKFCKYDPYIHNEWYQYCFYDWEVMYKKYCSPVYKIPLKEHLKYIPSRKIYDWIHGCFLYRYFVKLLEIILIKDRLKKIIR